VLSADNGSGSNQVSSLNTSTIVLFTE